jgi:hypothetical protein
MNSTISVSRLGFPICFRPLHQELPMGPVTLDELKAFGSGLVGETLVTRFRKRHFSLSVTEEGFEYTPDVSGKRRKSQWRWIERFLQRYNEKRSLHPGDYNDISRNASYILTIIRAYLDSLSAPVPV